MRTAALVFLLPCIGACMGPSSGIPPISCRANAFEVDIGNYDPGSALCIPSRVNRDATGLVKCHLEATLAAVGADGAHACGELGEVLDLDLGTDATGRARCALRQAPVTAATRASGVAPTEPGAFFDDYTAASIAACGGAMQLTLTRPVDLRNAALALDCAQNAVPIAGDGTGASCMMPPSPCPAALVCEPASRTCQHPCTSDSDCATGLVCNTANPVAYCDNPLC